MYAANELATGCLLIVAGVLILLAPTLKGTLLRIGIALILIAAAIYGGWEWWMATRTWVPLYMPVSLAQGHIRSPEFKINLDAGFWIFVEVETKVDNEGVSCLTGYTSDYCRKNGVRELHASWTLSDRGRVVARGSTDNDQGSRGGMLSKARGLGNFSVPAGNHFVLDVEFPEDNSHFNGGHPRLAIVPLYYWRFDENRTPVFLFSMFLGAIGTALFVGGIVESRNRRRVEQTTSLTSRGPIVEEFQEKAEPALTAGQNLQWAQRLTLRTQFSSPPAFALLAAPVLAILIMIYMVLLQPFPARGLYVKVLNLGPLVATDPLSTPVVVQILDAGIGVIPELYINSKPTSWNTFGDDLKNELKLRPKWVVHVQADPNLPWADIATAIDVAKGLHADVVLLTVEPTIKHRDVPGNARKQK